MNFDFDTGLSNENRNVAISLLNSHFKNNAINIIDLKDKKIPNIDFIISYKENKVFIESKCDSYPETGNIIIELISYCEEKEFSRLFNSNFSKKFSVRSSEHAELVKLIKKGKWNGKEGLGFSKDLKKFHLLFYIYYNVKKKKVIRYLFLNAREVNKFVSCNYHNCDLLITKTKSKSGRKWLTISSIIPLASLTKEVKADIIEL